ncbi:hypothetical protein QJS04_geneDACA006458 [Acorus gramineus]|uniref:Hydroxyproline-rich glycoprotein family protein n=1 Tax=Acorus gramineus TaxID=55184 RepID=A0AAV9AZB6_ACOGR|nr:hypothetical protein QJS04_geneDACA006458 [Acorus gramineus]
MSLTPPSHAGGPSTSSPSTSRPSLGFPLGTALLLIVIFCLSGIFSCCYHRDKLRSLRRSSSDDSDAITDPEAATISSSSSSKPVKGHEDLKKTQKESLPVLMPGDRMPKFIAWPCPCEPSPPDRITVEAPLLLVPPPPSVHVI